ncbi:hypothetical protein [Burkholderia gladioli]|uniref:hypothetical protein n=1 Tax=Burkholderia gladioli TaxID=28095 RepID=UPI001640B0F5|nr:hypothetical protein [Burkholderia gladioli]
MPFNVRHNPQNDLLNLANYHREVIEEKTARKEELGIALDCLSCLIALAFYVEALFNYVGQEKIPSWKERDSSPKKIKLVLCTLGLPVELDSEPFSAIATLREIRNGLAHGKPTRRRAQAANRLELNAATKGPWAEYTNPTAVDDLYRQVTNLRDLLFKAAGIRLGASLTSAVGSFG